MSKLSTNRSRNDLPAQILAGTKTVSKRLIRLGTTIVTAIAVAVLILFAVVIVFSFVATMTIGSHWSS